MELHFRSIVFHTPIDEENGRHPNWNYTFPIMQILPNNPENCPIINEKGEECIRLVIKN